MTLLLSPELVGRETESAGLERAIDSARNGAGGAFVLIGEPGIGKSRLRRHAEVYAQARGLLVLSGRSVDGSFATPLRPFAEALSSGFREAGMPREAALTPILPTLAHLVPHWSSKQAPEISALTVAEALLRLLEVSSRGRGAMLVLEDLHWADQDTLAVVEYLVDNVASHGALCLLTMRPEPPAASQFARRAADRRAATVRDLRPLTPPQVDAMTLACLGQDAVSADLLAFVRAHADGVPFFVEELLAGLARTGKLTATDGEWAVSGPLTAEVPTTFAESVTRRVAGLLSEDRTIVFAAALLGRDFDWSALSAITGFAGRTIVEGLRNATAVMIFENAGGVVRFRHALTREAILASMLPPERVELATRALAAGTIRDPGVVAELAIHADLPGRAADALLEAAEQARDRGALATAAARLKLASTFDPAYADRLLMSERLAEVHALAGNTDAAIALAETALAERVVSGSDTGRRIDLEVVLARALLTSGLYAKAQEHADHAYQSALAEGDAARQARASVVAAQIAAEAGDVAVAERLARETLGSIGTMQPEVRCEALEVLGRCVRLRDVADAERIFESALGVAEQHDLSLWRARALHELGTIDLLDRMSTDRLIAARRAAVQAGAPALAAVADFHLASALISRNSIADGRVAAQRAVGLAERLKLSVLAPALTILARSYAHERNHQAVADVVARIHAAAPGDPAVAAGVRSHVYAMLALHEADREAARTALDEAAELLRQRPGTHDPHRGLWALLCTLDGDGRAERTEAAEAAGADTRFNRAMLRAADAVAAGRDGNAATAESLFTSAVADLRGYQGAEWMVQLTSWIIAPAALADGWGEPAGMLQTAVRWFASHHYEPLAASCRVMLRDAGAPVPRSGRGMSAVPDQLRKLGVTSREMDVMRLVLAGLTNREIADRLVLSPKTVEKHVASVLHKTGNDDRTQLRGQFGSRV